MRLDAFESRLGNLSIECQTSPIRLRMRPGRLSRFGGVLLSKSSLRASFALLVFFLVLKQNKSASVSKIRWTRTQELAVACDPLLTVIERPANPWSYGGKSDGQNELSALFESLPPHLNRYGHAAGCI